MPYEIETKRKDLTVDTIHGLLPTPHIHSHLEMIFLTKGHSIVTSDQTEYCMKAGDCFLAFPNQIHFYHDYEPTEGYLLIFSEHLFPELKELFDTKVPCNPVLSQKQLPNDILELLQRIYTSGNRESMQDKMIAKGCLLTLLGEMFLMMDFSENTNEPDAVKRIITYCIQNYTQPLTLDMLSKELYLNKYYISHLFQERMQMSYRDFLNTLRIEHACEILGTGISMTQVAYASGFSSVRTFNRAFMKLKNMTPREYVSSIRHT